ncbi:hypothetical protein LIBO111022_01935 [Listeria booriae]|uniref:Uncharacterized protein n=1 Tax=Listeria booriae TaxID=1552123 RepID=A0A099WEW5_9LIST|nr:hypothetical protein [Listeria booriae]KGL43522.1 hypothetical protein EP57_02785 [Listeria booriae]MBC2243023.1 hypothetical protein [Listeria booriae]STY41147.1 Uncharacterised protein [Listeria booriae]
MERERALLEKQLEAATHKQRKLEDIQLALIQLNREKASILGSFQQAWQGNKADRVASNSKIPWKQSGTKRVGRSTH